jgi:hypothetical protein
LFQHTSPVDPGGCLILIPPVALCASTAITNSTSEDTSDHSWWIHTSIWL